jgi:hypothetical protein
VASGVGRLGHGGQLGDGLVLEYVGYREFQTDFLGGADHPDGEKGVPAQLEEVILDPDPTQPEQPRPEPGEGMLGRPTGSHVGAGPDALGQRLAQTQSLAVHLAIRQAGKLAYDENVGDHVGGQQRTEVIPQFGPFRGRPGHGHEAAQSGGTLPAGPGDHDGIGHRRMAEQCLLNFARLDANSRLIR